MSAVTTWTFSGERPKAAAAITVNPLDLLSRVTPGATSSARSSVSRETNPLYWDIIEAFRKRTGCPVIVNTSFNVRGEPIVCTPAQAFACFMRTEMDCLVVGDFLLLKSEQGPSAFAEDLSWQEEFQLD